MTDLKWTKQRHALLREIGAGQCEVHHGLRESLARKSTGAFLAGHQKGAATYLHDVIAWGAGGMGARTPARLTPEGISLLAHWDHVHPIGEAS